MTRIDVRAINLNLLPALEALLVEGSVGGAARRMHVTQSAMSHSLARLRAVFDDPLLVASGRTMTATPRARRLAAQLPDALDRLASAVAPPEAFDPARSTRAFRIATLDLFELTALPDLLAYLARHAPGVVLEIERFSLAQLPALIAGDVDLALIGASQPIAFGGLRRAELYDDPFAVIARPGHPALGRLTLEKYLAYGHVLVSVEGRRDGVVDRALAKLGRQRRIALRVPSFATAPLAVLGNDCLCTIASSVAHRARALFGVRVAAPPLALPAARAVALWSRRLDDDPGAAWLRGLIVGGTAASRDLRRLMAAPRGG